MEKERSVGVSIAVIFTVLQELCYLYKIISTHKFDFTTLLFPIVYIYFAWSIFKLKDKARREFIIYQIIIVIGRLLLANHSATFTKLAIYHHPYNWREFINTLALPYNPLRLIDGFYLPVPIFINIVYILYFTRPKVKEQFKQSTSSSGR